MIRIMEDSKAFEDENNAINAYFNKPKIPKLDAIIYAEFDNDIGRVVKYQVPREIFDRQRFESISSAVIPTEEMRGRMIKITMYDWKIIGFPMGIKDKKYPREVYIFNMCFVIAKKPDQLDIVYEPLVEKCAEYLIELEKEGEFLSLGKHKLPELMEEIFNSLNNNGECTSKITEQTTIYLKICTTFQNEEPPQVTPFTVPIFSCLPPPTSFERMDVLSQRICPQIDGIRCVKDIAYALQIDTDLVGRCIRNLCYHGCLTLLPLFLYTNSYIATEKIRHFFDSPVIIQQCLNYIKRSPKGPDVLYSDMARLYLNLKRGWTLTDWMVRMEPKRLNVDERRLIQFGIYYGFVRKQSIYPLAIKDCIKDEKAKIESLCNGNRSIEELALHYSCSPIELHKRLSDNGNFRFIYK